MSMWKQKELTEEQNWVIVNDNKIIEHYSSFKDAVSDTRGHLMSKNYYEYHYKDLAI
jgi:hypothetical protein